MARPAGEWAKEKLRLLEQYLPIYLDATKTAIDRIFVDGFAGPGMNRIKGTDEHVEGSPLISLNAESQAGQRFTSLYFIEKDRATAKELRNTLEGRADGERFEVIEGDVNTVLPALMARIHKRAPTFVFLDPEGIEPRWSTIQAISAWKTELLINFPYEMAINRNLDSGKVTAYFGTNDWRPIREAMRPDEAQPVVEFYKERLKSLGYTYQPDWSPLIRSGGGQKLYHLIHASKVEPAKRIMEWVQRQSDAGGQGKLF